MFTPEEVRAALRLYAVTDRRWLAGRSLFECVAAALAGGATCVQLREKGGVGREGEDEALRIRALCAEAGVPFIVNDDVALAIALDADGVHVGQGDMGCAHARELLGGERIIGVSAHTPAEALAAAAAGADYLGVGAVFPTGTKPEAAGIGVATVQAVCAAVGIPVVAIGGLDIDTIPLLAGSGVAGVAVVSAVFANDDIAAATGRLAACTKLLLSKPSGKRRLA